MSEEQDQEIADALGTGKGAEYDERQPFRRDFMQGSKLEGGTLSELGKERPQEGTDEWEVWAKLMTDQVQKLMADNRTLKIGLGVISFGVVLALGVGAMTSKGMTQLMGALKQLNDNQVELANYIGIQGNAMANNGPIATNPYPTDEKAPAHAASAKTFDVPEDAVVGDPYEGPASEASAEAQEQMAQDKAAGIIGQFKNDGDEVQ